MTPVAKTITFTDVEKKLKHEVFLKLRETDKFVLDDHWQDKKGWIGWQPLDVNSTSFSQDWLFLKKTFVFKNTIKRIIDRLVGAILGSQPDWSIQPNVMATENEDLQEDSEKTERLEAIEKILKSWYSRNKVLKTFKRLLANKAKHGKVGLRIYIPPAYVDKDGKLDLKVKDFESVLNILQVEVVDAYNCERVMDYGYGKNFTIVREAKDEDKIELEKDTYELNFLSKENKTCYRKVTSEDSGEDLESEVIEYNLGGNLLTEIIGDFDDAIITDSIKILQKALNHSKTMENFSIADINFPKMFLLNAVPFASKEKQKSTPHHTGSGNRLKLGMNTILNLMGKVFPNADGSVTQSTPNVKFREQPKPEEFIKSSKALESDIYAQAGMNFVDINSSPYPSGESRTESMIDYLILLIDISNEIETLGVWLFTTIIRFINDLTTEGIDNVERDNKVRELNEEFIVNFRCKITIKHIDNQDKTIMLQEVKDGVRSKRSYIMNAEVNHNPKTEITEITVEREKGLHNLDQSESSQVDDGNEE